MDSMRASCQGLQTTQWSLTPDICSHVVSNPNKSGMVCNIIKYGRGNNVSLRGCIINGIASASRHYSLHSSVLGEASYGIMRTFKQSSGEAHADRNHLARTNPPAMWVSYLAHGSSSPQSRLQTTAVPEISDWTTLETLSLNHLPEFLTHGKYE